MTYHQPFVQNPAGFQGSEPSEQALEQSIIQIRPRDDVFHESHSTWHHIPHHHEHHPGMCHPWGDVMVHPWEHAHYPSMIHPFMHHPWDPHMDDLDPYLSSGWDCCPVDYHHDWFHPCPWDHPHAHGHHSWDTHSWDTHHW
ncbi:hypothetical protein M5W83_28755 [Paenibacillus thiaminolyticus]|uniref:Uncharacterized protein n=1 Tax=Paenibacillus thiaminolyticus TaxID=49283 RepID=A0AAP9DQS8_PANTH|nr:hypothetical protein [Paenibacillus thiaminolyticus]MCY9534815.1 hypothetical protein [Paenibacillus thiaminolyticus]MCY9603940.1 hypothetical protein [Paenibacillus thiaminolyticus]MCY9611141.1 hypothetical protein [Paenibacillus thiaminolyticus]MCY9616566.1 hypothetical protein [Paenibacillus thiaminolyticus]MCY9622454.1 hypothetical protein [Paenibacillus thiaminolyticus]